MMSKEPVSAAGLTFTDLTTTIMSDYVQSYFRLADVKKSDVKTENKGLQSTRGRLAWLNWP